MMKKILIILATSTIVFGINFANAATSRDNKVCFDNAQIESFIYTGHAITDGQPFDKNIAKEGNCLYVQAGRKNHETSITWVKQNLSHQDITWDDLHMVATRVNNIGEMAVPDQLNFAFRGDLKLTMDNTTMKCYNVFIGQGHYLSTNNWWIFSNNSGTKDTDRWSLKCYTDKGDEVLIYPYSDKFNNYTFTLKFDVPTKNPSGIHKNTAS